ncbi:response regulator [Undibacterium sp. RTI2.1]|uniref:HD domain-containing phosphohydrolase n=1 Tax=unclassified Undibacterium TaxID=2630295 RepID=UPI002AB3F8B9|nr:MULTISPECIES: HD domain-containing phosphohydrolase [unclassified Undibacterium]MDY7537069.1 response regulator [Undibacterium sp. 5I1]MEB0029892.1 response regulator [Undibacterium sp. RTI2.1]MEB0115177.1 response regulator [Undibacterium sp. RTI2.2]MEB0229247.1 response regulator [Undibacterium sp. 10I3]MEB0256205.1 response regulator [Undibacterium sp. 5I1]
MKVLIVDDNATNLVLLSALAKAAAEVDVLTFEHPLKAIEWCQTNSPDLVLVDFMMPDMNGHQFIAQFRTLKNCADVPIVMVTTENEKNVRKEALSLGATEFLSKPVDPSEFRLRVKNLLALRHAQNLLKDQAKHLRHEVSLATASILEREKELVLRLSKAAEYRDPETGAHILRMAHYSALIAKCLNLTPEYQQTLLEAAPMHDIGKLATPDHILLKPGRLDADEMAIMKKHAEIGAEILSGSNASLIQLAAEIAGAHHEKFDGSGYPAGLVGNDIPLSGRIVAVADVFDALTSERPYKKAWSLDDARSYIADNVGSHFCPTCAHVFLNAWPDVLKIRSQFPD